MAQAGDPVFRKIDLVRWLAIEAYDEPEPPYRYVRNFPGGIGYDDTVIRIEPGDSALCDNNVYVEALGEKVRIDPYGEVGSWPIKDPLLHKELLCIVGDALRSIISEKEAIHVEATDHAHIAEFVEREYLYARPPGHGESKKQ